MRFAVPQFIDVEDKIFGPLTLKQAIYLAGAISFTAVIFLQFNVLFAILLGGPVLALAFLLAFIKVHGRPFINVLSSAFFYATKNKLYLWKHVPKKKKTSTVTLDTNDSQKSTTPEITQSNLKKLAWSLDTGNPFEKKKKRHQ